jgi:SAM-dependent methyltransferase
MNKAPKDQAAWRSLVDATSPPSRQAGRYAMHSSRGKLDRDPVCRHLLRRGLIAPRSRVLDIGCGEGLLASVLRVVTEQGRWPAEWAAAPVDARVTGNELVRGDVEGGRAAPGGAATFVCANRRDAVFPDTDVVVILDAPHHIGLAQQDRVLARARAALRNDGSLRRRVGDAGARRGFAFSAWLDRAVMGLRGDVFGPLVRWVECLRRLGFAVDSEPMDGGLPFANLPRVARVATAAHS